MEPEVKRHFKTLLYEQFARMGKALANAHRLELLDLLSQGERTVEALAEETGMSMGNASQHLQVLRAARLVESRRTGVSSYYHLASDHVSHLWLALRACGKQHLTEVDHLVRTFLQDRASLQPVTIDELREAFPVAELESRLWVLPQDREIVAYCRGPYCVFADEAVALLRAHGYPARHPQEGLPEWRALGLPVAL